MVHENPEEMFEKSQLNLKNLAAILPLYGENMSHFKMKTYRVFVYGSLLKGLSNHRLLENNGVKFICNDTIRAQLFTSHWGWPFLILSLSNKYKVYGEVYDVDHLTFKNLDALEGYIPNDQHSLFFRKIATTNRDKYRVHVYEGGLSLRKSNRLFRINTGNWKKAYIDYHSNKLDIQNSPDITNLSSQY